MLPKINLDKLAYYWQSHHKRFQRFVELNGLICQECGGLGGDTDPILDDGTGPWEECHCCEGTGKITPHQRWLWLKMKREKKEKSCTHQN